MPGSHALQSLAAAEPTTVLRVPAGHGTHSVAPLTLLKFPGGHRMHAEGDFAPIVTEKVPASQ